MSVFSSIFSMGLRSRIITFQQNNALKSCFAKTNAQFVLSKTRHFSGNHTFHTKIKQILQKTKRSRIEKLLKKTLAKPRG